MWDTNTGDRNGNGSGSGWVFPYLDPAHLLNGFFSRGPDLPHWAPQAPWAPLGRGTSGPILWPNKKKKCLPDIDFLNNQTGGEKEHLRKPIIF